MLLGFFQAVNFAQQKSSMWDLKTGDEVQKRGRRFISPDKFLVYGLNRAAIARILNDAPLEFTSAARLKNVVLEIPSPDGTMKRFRIEDSPILSPEIAAQFPDWKTYQGYGIDDPTATARFDVTPSGFHAYVLNGDKTFAIDPFQENDRGNYQVYFKRDFQTAKSFVCNLPDHNKASFAEPIDPESDFSVGTQIRTYRLAMAATAEYTNFFRQPLDDDAAARTRAFDAIVITVNRVIGVFRRDLALSFTIISGTNIIYTDTETDPYLNSSGDLENNQNNLDAVVGTANYDIGHLVGTGGGGVAGLGVPCRADLKGFGLTGSSAPVGDPFDIDYVAHEMGHQVGANHTFNATNDNCSNRVRLAAYEPGRGATIMAYAGICGAANLQINSIDNFHIRSQTEAITYTTGGGLGATCGTLSGGAPNAIPVIAPLTNYSIPFNTPFTLTAAATDGNGGALTYSWEQYDLGGIMGSTYTGSPDDDDVTLVERPLFRTYSPTARLC